jgi:hypothetical protein
VGFFLEFNVGPLGWFGFVLDLELDIGVAGGSVLRSECEEYC